MEDEEFGESEMVGEEAEMEYGEEYGEEEMEVEVDEEELASNLNQPNLQSHDPIQEIPEAPEAPKETQETKENQITSLNEIDEEIIDEKHDDQQIIKLSTKFLLQN